MQISFLIVTKNRPDELRYSLTQLQNIFDPGFHEVLVFIDGCKATEKIQNEFPWVKWYSVQQSISASPARNFLYQKAVGEIFIGLDDDAHLISEKPLEIIQSYFVANKNLGIITFLELKGIFDNPKDKIKAIKKEEFSTNEFIGCGFAIRKSVYDKTNGFPVWMDIYGEETAVSLEVLDLGFEMLFTNQIVVNHRIDIEKRKLQGKNYFRFQRQLQNSFGIYVVYYQYPFKKILKLLWHNFKKYAISDKTYFNLYCRAIGNMIINFPMLFKHRKTVAAHTLHKLKTLRGISY